MWNILMLLDFNGYLMDRWAYLWFAVGQICIIIFLTIIKDETNSLEGEKQINNIVKDHEPVPYIAEKENVITQFMTEPNSSIDGPPDKPSCTLSKQCQQGVKRCKMNKATKPPAKRLKHGFS